MKINQAFRLKETVSLGDSGKEAEFFIRLLRLNKGYWRVVGWNKYKESIEHIYEFDLRPEKIEELYRESETKDLEDYAYEV